MKKTALTLAVAAAMATIPLAAQADTILYGEAKVSVDYVDDSGDLTDSDRDGYWDVVNNGSKLGIKGFEDLGSGLQAFYQYEFSVDMTEGGNFSGLNQKFVGLAGGFGTVTVGTQDTPYWKILNVIDIFHSSRMFDGAVYLGAGLSAETNTNGALGTLANSIDYRTPNFGGFSAEALLVLDGRINDRDGFSDSVDIWNINLKYSQGPIFAGLTYIKLDGDDDVNLGQGLRTNFDLDNWGLGLGYKTDQFLIGAIYEQGTFNVVNSERHTYLNGVKLATGDDAQSWMLAGQYAFGNNVVRAAYGQTDTGIDGEDSIDNWRVGYQYNFSKRTLLWAEYFGREADTLFFGDQNAISLGMKHLF
ncbi:MAG: porin [Candidatus Competibacteraceae bacterium]|nr:porin [Candidatus Competibacteraceae bacterium]